MCAKLTDVIGIIPARYGSTRFPGKPLAGIAGRPMVEHVWRRASEVLGRVVIATDDSRILDAAVAFGAEAVMTSPDCPDGTRRVLEAYRNIGAAESIIVNIQGDEPLLRSEDIRATARLLVNRPEAHIATLASRFKAEDGFEALFDPNRVKLVTDIHGKALYFSRSIVPYVRGTEWKHWLDAYGNYLIHIGLYAYRADVLPGLAELPESPLEKAEKLEQLRWLWAGYEILTAVTEHAACPVDTPADLERVRQLMKAQ